MHIKKGYYYTDQGGEYGKSGYRIQISYETTTIKVGFVKKCLGLTEDSREDI